MKLFDEADAAGCQVRATPLFTDFGTSWSIVLHLGWIVYPRGNIPRAQGGTTKERKNYEKIRNRKIVYVLKEKILAVREKRKMRGIPENLNNIIIN